MDRPPLEDGEGIIVVVFVMEYKLFGDCVFASVPGHLDIVNEFPCFEPVLAVMVTSGFPPLPEKIPWTSVGLAFLFAAVNTSAMLLLNVKGMAPDPVESLLFLNS